MIIVHGCCLHPLFPKHLEDGVTASSCWLYTSVCLGKCVPHMCVCRRLCDSVLMATRGSWDLCLCAFMCMCKWQWLGSALPLFLVELKDVFLKGSKAHPGWCRAGWDFSSSSQTQTLSYTVQRILSLQETLKCVWFLKKRPPKFLLRFNNPLSED